MRKFLFLCCVLVVKFDTLTCCTVVNGTLDLSRLLSSGPTLNKDALNCTGHYGEVTDLILTHNSLTSITNDTFESFYNVKHLDLSFNQIEQFPDDVFLLLWQLETLNATHNNISRLQASLLDNKMDLISVNFDYNNISEVELGFVNERHEKLVYVSLQHNSLEVFEPWPYTIYKNSDKNIEQEFHLEYNNIRQFRNPQDWHYDLIYPHNRLVFLMHNQIHSASMTEFRTYFENVGSTNDDFYVKFFTLQLNITANPYQCDCNVYEFAYALRNSVYKWANAEDWQFTCESPAAYYGEDWLRLLPYEKMVCNLTQDCPSGCFCQTRPYDGTTFVNCTGANLTEMPDRLPITNYKDLVLILDDNHIQELKQTHYIKDIMNISLVGNRVHTLNSDIVKNMTNLKKFDLRNNNLNDIPMEIQRLDYSDVSLHGNPIRCHCDMMWLGEWIRLARRSSEEDLRCSEDGGEKHKITDVTLSSLKCTKAYLIPLFVTIGLCLVGCIVAGIFAKRCPYETKVLLYKFACIHPGDKYEVDNDPEKEYDVYFSYDHEEYDVRQWTHNILTKKLQKKFKSIKTYNPLIDFDPSADSNGQYDEYNTALEKSKRILIILSAGSFVPDNRQEPEILGCEFETGDHGKSYGRIIYILYNSKAKYDLDNHIKQEPWKSRLAGKTVLTPDDKLFYSKLRYEMPQHRHFRRRVAPRQQHHQQQQDDLTFVDV